MNRYQVTFSDKRTTINYECDADSPEDARRKTTPWARTEFPGSVYVMCKLLASDVKPMGPILETLPF